MSVKPKKHQDIFANRLSSSAEKVVIRSTLFNNSNINLKLSPSYANNKDENDNQTSFPSSDGHFIRADNGDILIHHTQDERYALIIDADDKPDDTLAHYKDQHFEISGSDEIAGNQNSIQNLREENSSLNHHELNEDMKIRIDLN